VVSLHTVAAHWVTWQAGDGACTAAGAHCPVPEPGSAYPIILSAWSGSSAGAAAAAWFAFMTRRASRRYARSFSEMPGCANLRSRVAEAIRRYVNHSDDKIPNTEPGDGVCVLTIDRIRLPKLPRRSKIRPRTHAITKPGAGVLAWLRERQTVELSTAPV
jgi:hypothetical protein